MGVGEGGTDAVGSAVDDGTAEGHARLPDLDLAHWAGTVCGPREQVRHGRLHGGSDGWLDGHDVPFRWHAGHSRTCRSLAVTDGPSKATQPCTRNSSVEAWTSVRHSSQV